MPSRRNRACATYNLACRPGTPAFLAKKPKPYRSSRRAIGAEAATGVLHRPGTDSLAISKAVFLRGFGLARVGDKERFHSTALPQASQFQPSCQNEVILVISPLSRGESHEISTYEAVFFASHRPGNRGGAGHCASRGARQKRPRGTERTHYLGDNRGGRAGRSACPTPAQHGRAPKSWPSAIHRGRSGKPSRPWSPPPSPRGSLRFTFPQGQDRIAAVFFDLIP